MFQVIHNKCTLNIQASNCVQEREWLDTLNRLIQLNQSSLNLNKIQSFNNMDTTTTNTTATATATNNNNNNNNSATTAINNNLTKQNHTSSYSQQQTLSFDLSIRLDPDRELARIYSLFISNIESIRTILGVSMMTINDPCNHHDHHNDDNDDDGDDDDDNHNHNHHHRNCHSNIVKFWKGNCHNYPPSQFIIEDRTSLMATLNILQECIGNIEQMHKQYLTSIMGSEIAPIENVG